MGSDFPYDKSYQRSAMSLRILNKRPWLGRVGGDGGEKQMVFVLPTYVIQGFGRMLVDQAERESLREG